ncbi:alkyl hydroperoxide reductase subunit F [Lysobacter pythonis]|uniref:Alkyl hydroperoxide reductase subunit F n=1 Tax=Solilutibacter pythonis TaxID=2483112 RepID=A0A3M2HJQ1_9GAMM|nr:alkyl hydroperoxide reductase subunit F [Lysobacter pythonis]RMH87609.1 alkyl hydroperoxide reductase subunit F [Lysobacter pythonis]
MLDTELKTQLTAYLERLQAPLTLVATLDQSEASHEMRALLGDIVEAGAGRISLKDAGDADIEPGSRIPSFRITREDADLGVSFAGLPLGHEFTSLVLALLHVGGYPPKLDDDLVTQIKSLEGAGGESEFRFETFFSQSCQSCPEVVQALNTMAALNPRIRHNAVDGAAFADEMQARGVMAVPTVLLNGQPFGAGRMGIAEIIAKLDTGAAEKAARAIDDKAPFDVLVVGGGPAGAAAAIYSARKGIRTGVLAERFGGQVLDTLAIENFVSVSHTEGPKLAAALENHVGDYDVDVMNLQRAEKLEPVEGGFRITTASGASVQTKSLILSTGARWRRMNVPGEEQYLAKGVAFCPHCDGPLFKGKRVAVIGGGNSGVEAAIDLAGIVGHVTLIEFDAKLRADEVLQAKLKSLPNVRIITSALTTEVLGDGGKVTGLAYQDRVHGEKHALALEGIFVQIGLLPNTEWLKDSGIELSPRGEIVIDERGATSLPGVFAAGDATTVPYKQIIIAMGAGATASLSAFDHLIRSSAPAEQTKAA